jgi:uncharacterized protein (TIGR02646 family)
MIKIIKGDAPEELIIKGIELTHALEIEFEKNKNEYLNGNKKFEFTDDYKSEDVKSALKKCQHNKCCFSEAKFNGDYPHIEHFRPKGRVDDYSSGVHHFPGYYWLCYDWSNLFFCKSVINVTYKRNYFPLLDDSTRKINHNCDKIELPLIIDPSIDDPKSHIGFHKDELVPKTERGRLNIEILGLRDPTFAEARRTKFELIKDLKAMVDLAEAEGFDENNPIVASSIAKLNSAILPDAEFSSMVKDFLKGWPHLSLDQNNIETVSAS